MIANNPAPLAGCDDQHAGDPGVAGAERTLAAIHRTAAMGRGSAERAVVQATLVAADDPAAIALGEDIEAESDQLDDDIVVDGNRASVPRTLPEAVKAFCDRVRKFFETRFGFAVFRRAGESKQAATPAAATPDPGRQKPYLPRKM